MYCPYDILLDPNELGLSSSLVDVNGRKWHVVQSMRKRSDCAVVFLHGVGMDWSAWTPLVQAARAEGVDTSAWVLLDLPGFGRSDDLPLGATMDDAAELVEAYLSTMGARSVQLVGHSMGGFLALHLLARHRLEYERSVIFSGAYSGIVDAVNHPLSTVLKRPSTAATYAGLRAVRLLGGSAGAFLAGASRLGLLPIALRSTVAHPRRLRPSVYRAIAKGFRATAFARAEATGVGYSVRESWSQIDVGIEQVYGQSDVLVTEGDAALLAQCVQGGSVTHRLREAGHFAPIEQPHQCLDLLVSAHP